METEMGRTYAKVKVRNESDLANKRRGLTDTIREMEIDFFIDTGASKLYLPTAYIEKLGLTYRRDALVRTGAGDVKRRVFSNVEITVGERITTAEVIKIPNDDNIPPILGKLILNGLDLMVDQKTSALFPRRKPTIFTLSLCNRYALTTLLVSSVIPFFYS